MAVKFRRRGRKGLGGLGVRPAKVRLYVDSLALQFLFRLQRRQHDGAGLAVHAEGRGFRLDHFQRVDILKGACGYRRPGLGFGKRDVFRREGRHGGRVFRRAAPHGAPGRGLGLGGGGNLPNGGVALAVCRRELVRRAGLGLDILGKFRCRRDRFAGRLRGGG